MLYAEAVDNRYLSGTKPRNPGPTVIACPIWNAHLAVEQNFEISTLMSSFMSSEDAAAVAFCPKEVAKTKDKLGPNMQQMQGLSGGDGNRTLVKGSTHIEQPNPPTTENEVWNPKNTGINYLQYQL